MGLRLVTVLNLVRSLRDGRPIKVLVDDYWNVFTDGDVARADGGQEQIDWSSEVTRAANLAIANAAGRTGGVRVALVNAFRDARDGDATPLLTDDGDHPNAAGVRVIVAANLAAVRV